MQIVCLNCGNRFGDVKGDLRQFHCAYCGSPKLVRIQTEDERRRDALLGLAGGQQSERLSVGRLELSSVGFSELSWVLFARRDWKQKSESDYHHSDSLYSGDRALCGLCTDESQAAQG